MNNVKRTKLLILILTTLVSLNPTSSKTNPTHLENIPIISRRVNDTVSTFPDLHKKSLTETISRRVNATFPELHKKSLTETISRRVNATIKQVYNFESIYTSILHSPRTVGALNSIQLKGALVDCLELLDKTANELQTSLLHLSESNGRRLGDASKYKDDIQTMLSSAMTNQYTCLDGFQEAGGNHDEELKNVIEPMVDKISQHVSNSLAMLNKIQKEKKTTSSHDVINGFPGWMSRKDRRMLTNPVSEKSYDVVVAQDGTGNFKTVNEAVAAAPSNSEQRYVIYIKNGVYKENVEVDNTKTNLMFLGDGIQRTVITGSRSVQGGATTFNSATVAVGGSGFMAKGITFENTAGPQNGQAVALRSSADFSAFYQCSFLGYQDTLYVHTLRQFYRECDVYGTIDFIFGNAAVVFQNCNLYARVPMHGQSNMFTAQGRTDPNQNTGISIINSKVSASSDLNPVKSSVQSFLGRPWKEYSRTVYIKSYLDDLIDPAGWSAWSGDFALNTLYYGEYQNTGPRADTGARVNWPGYRVIQSPEEANQFTVGNFINGADWLPSYDIPFDLGL